MPENTTFVKKNIELKSGDEVFARNFTQSDASKKFSSKLAPVFIASKVLKKEESILLWVG